jgi:predicted PurR-regulated permease PerM
MAKLITLLLVTVLIFGISTYIFFPSSGTGVQQIVQNGHNTITNKVRGFDYVTN